MWDEATQDGAENKRERECDANNLADDVGLVGRADFRKADGGKAVEASTSDALEGAADDARGY